MLKVYFVHHDPYRINRQSDGLEFCFMPEFCDNKIYLYCHEYQSFWDSIADAGHPNQSLNIKLNGLIRPVTLVELSEAGLLSAIDSIKEYHIENGKLLGLKYINIPK